MSLREVFVKDSYGGEIVPGDPENILTVFSKTLGNSPDSKRIYFVHATAQQEEWLIRNHFAVNTIEAQHMMDKFAQMEGSSEEVEADPDRPSEYECLDCKKTHIRGTPEYFAHLDRYLNGQWSSLSESREEEEEDEEEVDEVEVGSDEEAEEEEATEEDEVEDASSYEDLTVSEYTEILERETDIEILKETFESLKASSGVKGKVGKLKAIKARVNALKEEQ